MESNFTNEQIIALAKLVSEKDAKKASASLTVGDHTVDFVLRVSGTFKKGADYEQKFVAQANPWGLLAVALSKLNGVTVESLVREHLDMDKDTADQIKEKANAALQAIKAPTVQKANGKVSSVMLAGAQIPVVSIEDVNFGRRAPYAVTEEVA